MGAEFEPFLIVVFHPAALNTKKCCSTSLRLAELDAYILKNKASNPPQIASLAYRNL